MQQASQPSYVTFIKASPVTISCYLLHGFPTLLKAHVSFCILLILCHIANKFILLHDELFLVLQIGLLNSFSLPLLIKKVYGFLKVNFFHTCDVLVVVRALWLAQVLPAHYLTHI